MHCMGSVVVAPSGAVRTTLALTASWPSRYTVAVMANSSPTTDFDGRVPSSTSGNTSATGIRPSGLVPTVGGTRLGGAAGLRGARGARGLAGVVVSVTGSTGFFARGGIVDQPRAAR